MKRIQAGFTMIELIVVIVILGVLAAVAMPKFIDLGSDAKQSAVDGVAGALSSAMALNYGARKANSSKGQAVTNCSDGAALLQGGALPNANYSITPAAINAEENKDCTVTGEGSKTAIFKAIGIN